MTKLTMENSKSKSYSLSPWSQIILFCLIKSFTDETVTNSE